MFEPIRFGPPALESPTVDSRRPPRARLAMVLAAVAAVLVVSSPAVGQEPSALGEREFLERFERSDPRFQVLAARIDESRADITDAKVLPNPSLAFDREEGAMLERLVLRPELGAFEASLRERIDRLAGLEDERLARPRSIERESSVAQNG